MEICRTRCLGAPWFCKVKKAFRFPYTDEELPDPWPAPLA